MNFTTKPPNDEEITWDFILSAVSEIAKNVPALKEWDKHGWRIEEEVPVGCANYVCDLPYCDTYSDYAKARNEEVGETVAFGLDKPVNYSLEEKNCPCGGWNTCTKCEPLMEYTVQAKWGEDSDHSPEDQEGDYYSVVVVADLINKEIVLVDMYNLDE